MVILRAGGSGSALNVSSLAEDLASHGYVVVGLDIATTAKPELCAGATTIMAAHQRYWPRNRSPAAARYVRRRFKSRLDLTRVGVFGHSFGAQMLDDWHPLLNDPVWLDLTPRLEDNAVETSVGRSARF